MAFDVAKFKASFPEYASEDGTLVLSMAEGVEFIAATCHPRLWQLATAHAFYLRAQRDVGQVPSGAKTSASVGGVSVGYTAPVAGDALSHWFTLSPYGLEYLALLERCKPRVKYLGGSTWGRRYEHR